MTEPHKQIGTVTRTVEVMSSIAVALTVLSFIYVAARFIRWAVDPTYHLFRH